ncbi:hypothetical protein [Methanoculleus chikugoensis]|uniref:hypothetical protein n=1 Tax=Methanoculleus chikugoensis TaxID=118126 RepID=UPI001FB53564|nr:hypothetical protein [Methanoculleus chikugoensis]
MLVIYASGIAAVKKGHLSTLEAILTRPKIKTYINISLQRVPYYDEVNIWFTMACDSVWFLSYNQKRYGEAGNVHDYLYRTVQSIIQPIMPNEHAYDGGAFDTFEYLYGLSYLRLASSPLEGKSAANPPLPPLLSRVWVKTVGFGGKGKYAFPEQVIFYLRNIQKKAEGTDFFGGGDLQKFERQNRAFADLFGIQAPRRGGSNYRSRGGFIIMFHASLPEATSRQRSARSRRSGKLLNFPKSAKKPSTEGLLPRRSRNTGKEEYRG